jgi:hypothetical protein
MAFSQPLNPLTMAVPKRVVFGNAGLLDRASAYVDSRLAGTKRSSRRWAGHVLLSFKQLMRICIHSGWRTFQIKIEVSDIPVMSCLPSGVKARANEV